MGRALIWVESLAAALLLVATVAAWSARRFRGLGRWVMPGIVALVVVIPAGLVAWGVGYLRSFGTVSASSFFAATGWALVFVVGAVIVVASGLRTASDTESAAQPAPTRSLAIAFAAAAILTAITVSNLDVAVKAQLAALRVEAGAKALALLPLRPPDPQNAAAVYQKAFAALALPDRLPALLRDRAAAWASYDRAAFDAGDREQREFLDSQQRGLALLRQAAAMPHCSFDRPGTFS